MLKVQVAEVCVASCAHTCFMMLLSLISLLFIQMLGGRDVVLDIYFVAYLLLWILFCCWSEYAGMLLCYTLRFFITLVRLISLLVGWTWLQGLVLFRCWLVRLRGKA